MRTFRALIFDEFVHGAGPHYSSSKFYELLGSADKLAFQMVVDDADANGTAALRYQHSSDGRNFNNKNTSDEISGSISASAQTSLVGNDDGAKVSLDLGRVSISLTTTTKAHVRVWATGHVD